MIIQEFELGTGKAPTSMFYLKIKQEILENIPDIPCNWNIRSKYFFDTSPHNLSSNTYFNRLDVGNLNRIATIDELSLTVQSKQKLEIRIMSSSSGCVKLFKMSSLSEGVNRFLLPTVNIDYLWLDFTSDQPINPNDLKYSYELPEITPLSRPITIGICTTAQGKMVEKLSDEISEASFANQISEILVVDHGNQSILDALTDKKKVRIIRQPNTGAAGGFARLMYESLHSQGGGTFLFDEDIDVEMFVIKRMLAFAAVSRNRTVIGTQTLNFFKRDHYWMEYEVIDVGRGVAKALPFSLNRQNVQIPQKHFQDINSIPWTCAYFPNTALEVVGLPIPIFFHCDDWDYSLRLEKKNIQMVIPSGFGHWHLPPDAKSMYSWALYFDVRNLLILQSIHGARTSRTILKFQIKAIFCLLSHRYQACERILRGISDYRNGPGVINLDQLERAKCTSFESTWREHLPIEYYQFQPRRFHKVKTGLEIFRNLFAAPSDKTTFFPLRNSHRSEVMKSRQAIILSDYGDEIEFLSYERSALIKLFTKLIQTGFLATLPNKKVNELWRNFAFESVNDANWIKRWNA
jgi:GT2 family glycosyltransferase